METKRFNGRMLDKRQISHDRDASDSSSRSCRVGMCRGPFSRRHIPLLYLLPNMQQKPRDAPTPGFGAIIICFGTFSSTDYNQLCCSYMCTPQFGVSNTTCNSEELFDDFEVETTEAGRFRTSFHVPRVYFPYVIGQKGNTRRRLENETKTQIRVPKMGQDGDISNIPYSS
ncbi:unnamed protein product, partial [Timema podura]|nr:unnamed protein product [Timema podura]